MESCEVGVYTCPPVVAFVPVEEPPCPVQRTEVYLNEDAVTDLRLVERARRGDSQALAELIERNYRHCLRIALGILRNRDDAEEEVQNAFCKAIERLEQFKGEGPFSSWLARIVANESYVRCRTERNVRFFHLDDSISGETGAKLELVDQTVLPDDELGRSEVMRILHTEIRRMPPLLRRVLQLRDIQQMPMALVATELHVTIPAAKSRLARARRELRSRLVHVCGRHGHSTLLQKSRSRPTIGVASGK